MKFAIYYAGDAYSTANKIMGRQIAGKAFMRAVARTRPAGLVHGVGLDRRGSRMMEQQLREDGFAGEFRWHDFINWRGAPSASTLYYPAPPPVDFAAARNLVRPNAFSLMGVTHTLSSAGAMDQLADLVFPPFKPWDALICTSRAAHTVVSNLHDEVREWWHDQTGASRFVQMELPIIPLGFDVTSFFPEPGLREASRCFFCFQPEEIVFLFAGRLSFHAKANPAPLYQALEKVAQQVPVACVEAGVFPNEPIKKAYLEAQRLLAPSVRFILVDGQDELRYRQAWQGADVFVSVADNIQETFGLTPVEAMAAGLPVVVSDWNGYKDTVRDGVDGFRVPTILPPASVGVDLALRHALGVDTYDLYIGRTSMATVAEPTALAGALLALALDGDKRRAMGAAALKRARDEYDWPVILRRYASLADELDRIRTEAVGSAVEKWPTRADPFARFGHFSSQTLGGSWLVEMLPGARTRLHDLLSLSMADYAFDALLLPKESLVLLLDELEKRSLPSVNELLGAAGLATSAGVRALQWLWKFDVVRVRPV
jgi:alpha-maltose-1-phosphate synthase